MRSITRSLYLRLRERLRLSRLERRLRQLLPFRRPTFEQQIFRAVVRPGDIIYDIGANVGDVAIKLARLAGPHGRVFAFEPVPPTYAALCKNIQDPSPGSAPIVPFPLGLSNADDIRAVNVPRCDPALASLTPHEAWRRAYGDVEVEEHRCQFSRLSRVVERYRLPKPDFVKIDVEGAELLVLTGGEDLFKTHQPLILIEIFAPWERGFGYTPWDVLSLLRSWDYAFLFACPLGLVSHDPSAERPTPPEYVAGYNTVAFVERRHASRIAGLCPLLAGGPTPVGAMRPAPLPNV